MYFILQRRKLLFLLFLLLGIRCQAQTCDSEVYPDFFIEEDLPFPEEVDTKRNVLYSAGYFTNDSNENNKKLYLRKYGLYYKSDLTVYSIYNFSVNL